MTDKPLFAAALLSTAFLAAIAFAGGRAAAADIKVLGDGELKSSLTVQAHKFSKSAQEKITQAGGKVEILS